MWEVSTGFGKAQSPFIFTSLTTIAMIWILPKSSTIQITLECVQYHHLPYKRLPEKYPSDRLRRMSKRKTAKKKSPIRKKISGSKISRRKKPIQRRKLTRSKGPGGGLSAQIHQGIDLETTSQSQTAPEIPDDVAEYGGES